MPSYIEQLHVLVFVPLSEIASHWLDWLPLNFQRFAPVAFVAASSNLFSTCTVTSFLFPSEVVPHKQVQYPSGSSTHTCRRDSLFSRGAAPGRSFYCIQLEIPVHDANKLQVVPGRFITFRFICGLLHSAPVTERSQEANFPSSA